MLRQSSQKMLFLLTTNVLFKTIENIRRGRRLLTLYKNSVLGSEFESWRLLTKFCMYWQMFRTGSSSRMEHMKASSSSPSSSSVSEDTRCLGAHLLSEDLELLPSSSMLNISSSSIMSTGVLKRKTEMINLFE